ncbi:hypothetical protein ZHAS_00003611 [Anopheles sinensis]|uniref:Uncharacterized protein n=1 Tax=Anopheles sinensis TaxID=74873 RepID=A0A084VET2_ANOSI|nr:hypothetical protein ZHAS_00003611 [Anopheles sinensis]
MHRALQKGIEKVTTFVIDLKPKRARQLWFDFERETLFNATREWQRLAYANQANLTPLDGDIQCPSNEKSHGTFTRDITPQLLSQV